MCVMVSGGVWCGGGGILCGVVFGVEGLWCGVVVC